MKPNFGKFIHKVGFGLKKHSPEILVVTGVVGTVVGTVLACKASTKVNAVLDKTKQDVKAIKEAKEQGFVATPEGNLPYTPADSKKELTAVYTKTGLKLAKLYGPAVAVSGVSIASILGGARIFKKRNIALAAAFTAVDNSFKGYRQRVIERFGEELDKELKYNIQTKEVEEKVVDEQGNEKTVTKTVKVANLDGPSEYARFYDVGQNGWTKNPEQNKWWLLQQQNYANEKLRAHGYLFLNDVYEALGIPKTVAGQAVGWLYDETKGGDGHVDFGIFNGASPGNRDFVNGYQPTILLDFNVDGPIYEDVERIEREQHALSRRSRKGV